MNSLLKHILGGDKKKEVTGRQGKRSKQLLDDLKEKRKYIEN